MRIDVISKILETQRVSTVVLPKNRFKSEKSWFKYLTRSTKNTRISGIENEKIFN